MITGIRGRAVATKKRIIHLQKFTSAPAIFCSLQIIITVPISGDFVGGPAAELHGPDDTEAWPDLAQICQTNHEHATQTRVILAQAGTCPTI